MLLNGVYADLKTVDPLNGLSIWLHACKYARPTILQMLLSAGCDIAETYVYSPNYVDAGDHLSGWSCLYFLVFNACSPRSSRDMEALQLLLDAGADPDSRNKGCTIFDCVDYMRCTESLGSYRRDLWYSALQRAHINIDRPADTRRKPPVYGWGYTPFHYRALCHLDSWEMENIEARVAPLLDDFPWSQEERQAISFYCRRDKQTRVRRMILCTRG